MFYLKYCKIWAAGLYLMQQETHQSRVLQPSHISLLSSNSNANSVLCLILIIQHDLWSMPWLKSYLASEYTREVGWVFIALGSMLCHFIAPNFVESLQS